MKVKVSKFKPMKRLKSDIGYIRMLETAEHHHKKW
jgi:hypothetical protein